MIKQITFITPQNEKYNNNDNNKKEKRKNLRLKISSKNIEAVCEQLNQIIDYIRNTTKFERDINNYSTVLEKKLKNSTEELEQMLREIKSVYTNIQKQKLQQKFIDKEKKSVEKTLNKLKDTEIREMEVIVSLFDKQMFDQWESIKSTRKLEAFEGLLTNIKSKQLALGNLETLVSRKLTNLKMFPTQHNLTDDSNNKIASNPIALPFLPLEIEILENITIPPPPPLPSISPSPMPSFTPSSSMYNSNDSTMRNRQRSQIDKHRRIEQKQNYSEEK